MIIAHKVRGRAMIDCSNNHKQNHMECNWIKSYVCICGWVSFLLLIKLLPGMVMRLCAVVTDLCPSLSLPHTPFLCTHRNHHHMRIDTQQPQIRLGWQMKQAAAALENNQEIDCGPKRRRRSLQTAIVHLYNNNNWLEDGIADPFR